MYLDFEVEVESQSTSWERADPDGALIERTGPTEFRVMLPGGEVHTCHYGTERGGHVGYCDCKGWEYRDDDASPCAHLCTLRQAEFIGDRADDGERITAESTIGEIDAGATETEPELRADGGRGHVDEHVEPTPAGADGRTFGTPEGRL